MQIVLCQTPVLGEFLLLPRISAFVGTNDYQVNELMITSRQQVQEQLSFLDEAESEFVSAVYTCQNNECTLMEVQIKFFVERKIACIFGSSSFSSDNPYASTVTHFSFDIANDELSTITQARDVDRRNLLPWEELPLRIDEIIQIALEAEGAEYAVEHPEYELGVTLLRDRWALAFRSDTTTVPDIGLHIDYHGKLIEE